MTKQEQIYKIAKYVCNACEFGIYRACSKSCSLALGTAKRIYNAGYQKIDDLKAENNQLKTECALLDDELRIARQDTIDVLNKLKSKCHNYYPSIDHYCCSVKAVNLSDIDELIKELIKNDEDKS